MRNTSQLSARALASVRALALPAIAAALLVAPNALALTVEGHVYLGEVGKPLAKQTVQIHVIRGSEELPGGTTRTDAQGRYRFTGLKSEEGLSYYLATEYEGAFYTEGPMPPSGETIQRDIIVFEVGDDLGSVRVTNQHVILEKQGDGFHVTEVLVFQNDGKTAFLGAGLGEGEKAGMRIGLPPSVKDFQVGMGGDPATMAIQGRDLASRRPIPPGMRPFSFTYHLPLSGRIDFSHRFHFPTETFVLMIDDPKLRVESPQLQSSGTRQQGQKNYTIYTGSGFTAGQEASIRIQGGSAWGNPGIYPWLAAPVLVGIVLWLALRRGRRAQAVAATAREHETAAKVVAMPAPSGAPPAPAAGMAPGAHAAPAAHAGEAAPGDFAQVYLYLISALDQANAKGEFSKDAYALVRRNLKRKLEVVSSDGTSRAKH